MFSIPVRDDLVSIGIAVACVGALAGGLVSFVVLKTKCASMFTYMFLALRRVFDRTGVFPEVCGNGRKFTGFMPANVPSFRLGEQFAVLAKLLEDLPSMNEEHLQTFMRTLNVDSKILEHARSFTDEEAAEGHCMMVWLLHVLQARGIPYPSILEEIDHVLGEVLKIPSCAGSTNVCKYFNWQCDHAKPGAPYDPSSMTADNLRPRFSMLREEKSSFWHFSLMHILMEMQATPMFHSLLQAATAVKRGKDFMVWQHIAEAEKNMRKIVRTLSKFMADEMISPEHWPQIHRILKVQCPAAGGMTGAQNCWVTAMDFVIGMAKPSHPHICKLQAGAVEYLLPHQKCLMDEVKEAAKILQCFMSTADREICHVWAALIRQVMMWHSIHRNRIFNYVKNEQGGYHTSGQWVTTENHIRHMLDSRLKEYKCCLLSAEEGRDSRPAILNARGDSTRVSRLVNSLWNQII